MFISTISGNVTALTPNNQTRFQCSVTLTVALADLESIEPGRLLATENVFYSTKDKRYTILQIVDIFPAAPEVKSKKTGLTLLCTATPIGQELTYLGPRKGVEIASKDTFPAIEGKVEVLDDEMTRSIIHHIAPDSRMNEDGARIDIGTYRSNPNVAVGMDASTLLRGNSAVISARPRARTTITYDLIAALLNNPDEPVHIVYCDVNNMGSLSLTPLLTQFEHASIVCLNDKFVPGSVFNAMRNVGDRSAHKRAVLDFLDMMILPSVLEGRRHDFSYAVSAWIRTNKISIYRPNEQTVDQFVNDIRVDVLDGADEEVEEFIIELMNGIAETYRGERFNDKNTRDMLDMIDEFGQDSRSHSARRTLSELKSEIQAVFETYSKDIPSAGRKSILDIVTQLNNDAHSSLTVVQGQKTTDIMRFVGTLAQSLIDERLKRLKIKVPVLFIFNNVDDYVNRNGNGTRDAGTERFADGIQLLLANGRRHGLGFCLSFESAFALDRSLARRIQSYFIGPITFIDEPGRIADLLNISEDLLRPAVRYEDGDFLFTSADSPYHRRVPLPVCTAKNTTVTHAFLDALHEEHERRRNEYFAQEEERRKRFEQERAKAREEKAPEDQEAQSKSTRKDRESSRRNDRRGRDKGTGRASREVQQRETSAASESTTESDIIDQSDETFAFEAEAATQEVLDDASADAKRSEKSETTKRTTRTRRGGRGRSKTKDSSSEKPSTETSDTKQQPRTPPDEAKKEETQGDRKEARVGIHELTFEEFDPGGASTKKSETKEAEGVTTAKDETPDEGSTAKAKTTRRTTRGKRGGKSSKKTPSKT